MERLKKSKKTHEELKKEEAERSINEEPYQTIRLDDPLIEEKLAIRNRVRGRWERLREKLDRNK